MKGHAIRGKTVKKLHQVLWESNTGKVWIVDAIEFTNGTFLRFLVAEGEGDYGVAQPRAIGASRHACAQPRASGYSKECQESTAQRA